MAENKAVTVTETVAGQTLVVNNRKDGIKKYASAGFMWLFGVLIVGISQRYPQYEKLILAVAAMLFGAGGVPLTSPFDKRGVILHTDGAITGDKVARPVPPTAPGSGVGMSMLICCLGGFLLIGTGCATTETRGTPPACRETLRTYPVIPIATATKVTPTAKVATVGLKNPGAEPGEIYSAAQGGASCQQKLTANGWVTICPEPNDGDAFDTRNEARANALASFPGLLGRP